MPVWGHAGRAGLVCPNGIAYHEGMPYGIACHVMIVFTSELFENIIFFSRLLSGGGMPLGMDEHDGNPYT